MILAQTVHEIYNSKAVRCRIFSPFSNVDNFRPEVASDVISGVVVDYVGVDVRATFGNLGETVAELFYSLASRTGLRVTFVQYLIAFCSRLEVMCDVIYGRFVGPVVPITV